MRCSRLAAANEVLREAQQFLISKAEASAEHTNMLLLELASLRKDREEVQTAVRHERLSLAEQQEDLQRQWERLNATESAVEFSKKQLALQQQENALLRDQVVSLQETVNRLTDKLSSTSRRASSPGSGHQSTRQQGVLFFPPTHGGLNSLSDPPNFYHSPQRPLAERRDMVDEHEPRVTLPPLPDALLQQDSDHPSHFLSAASAPPMEAASLFHETPQRVFVQANVSPPPLPTPLQEYTKSMREALDMANYVSRALPDLGAGASPEEAAAGSRRGPAGSKQAAPSAFIAEYEAAFTGVANTGQQSEEAKKRFDVDSVAVSATAALKKFQEITAGTRAGSDDDGSPPPPPPPADDESPKPLHSLTTTDFTRGLYRASTAQNDAYLQLLGLSSRSSNGILGGSSTGGPTIPRPAPHVEPPESANSPGRRQSPSRARPTQRQSFGSQRASALGTTAAGARASAATTQQPAQFLEK